MGRQERSGQTAGSDEKKDGLQDRTLRNADGRYIRSDKKTGTIRKEGKKKDEGK